MFFYLFVTFLGSKETTSLNILTKADVNLIIEEITNHKLVESITLLNTKVDDECSLIKLLIAFENHSSLKYYRFDR